ncbi:MAG: hypothetical protein B0W54_01340 [Cellvibrio sp. 79]|nr:MAG: hypothetical protein B0W54_01340 [Cellvibrio sp. 79]
MELTHQFISFLSIKRLKYEMVIFLGARWQMRHRKIIVIEPIENNGTLNFYLSRNDEINFLQR